MNAIESVKKLAESIGERVVVRLVGETKQEWTCTASSDMLDFQIEYRCGKFKRRGTSWTIFDARRPHSTAIEELDFIEDTDFNSIIGAYGYWLRSHNESTDDTRTGRNRSTKRGVESN